MTSKQIFDFIEKAKPTFEQGIEKKYRMFTPSTQWIEADTIEELIIMGMEKSKKYNYSSPISYMWDKLEEGRINMKCDNCGNYYYEGYRCPNCLTSNTKNTNKEGEDK